MSNLQDYAQEELYKYVIRKHTCYLDGNNMKVWKKIKMLNPWNLHNATLKHPGEG